MDLQRFVDEHPTQATFILLLVIAGCVLLLIKILTVLLPKPEPEPPTSLSIKSSQQNLINLSHIINTQINKALVGCIDGRERLIVSSIGNRIFKEIAIAMDVDTIEKLTEDGE